VASIGLVALVLLQVFFIGRVAWMAVSDPASTAFERSQAWQILSQKGHLKWRQDWRPSDQISVNLKRAVLASEDSGFMQHKGVWWESIEKAWRKNASAQAKLDAQAAKANGKKTCLKLWAAPPSHSNWQKSIAHGRTHHVAQRPRVGHHHGA
jgi:monofunctional glycosyltransferase